jgi:hypothetical protein
MIRYDKEYLSETTINELCLHEREKHKSFNRVQYIYSCGCRTLHFSTIVFPVKQSEVLFVLFPDASVMHLSLLYVLLLVYIKDEYMDMSGRV